MHNPTIHARATGADDPQLPVERLLRASRIASWATVCLGLLVLAGWALNLSVLTQLHREFAAMKANTALLFVLLGIGLGLSEAQAGIEHVRHALASLVVLVATGNLIEIFFGVDAGIDQMLFRDPTAAAQGTAPGRMSPVTSLNFWLLGLALLARRSSKPDSRKAWALVLLAVLISFVSLAGYLFSVESLYRVRPFGSTALHALIGFLLASTAFVTARPRDGPMQLIGSPTAAGVLLRRVLPLALMGTLLFGWLQATGSWIRVRDIHFRIALFTVGDVILLSTVMYIAAVRLQRSELAREELTREREAAERLRERARFFELSIDMVCIANTAGRFLQLSPAFPKNLGYSIEDLLTHHFTEFVHPDDRGATLRELESLASGQPTIDFTNRYVCKDGSLRWLQWRAIAEPDGSIYAVARDVTRDREIIAALQHQRASLSSGLKEREVLLQEVHHRVKNNLQLISSLLNLQLRQLRDPEAFSALVECQARIQTIALIHEKLYQSRDYARVPFCEYVKNLAACVLHASGSPQGQIELRVDGDDVLLGVDRAIPCALLLNELLTNSVKHAFPDHRPGRLWIELRKSEETMRLSVSDDGIGLPPGLDPATSPSLGMQLVTTLTDQLGGQLHIDRECGTAFKLEFLAEEPA